MRDAIKFVDSIIDALEEDKIWIFLVRSIVLGCSESFLDITEEPKWKMVGRDTKNNSFQDLPNCKVLSKNTEKYRLIFNGSVTGKLKTIIIKPHQYRDYRFSICDPDIEYESKIHSPKAYPAKHSFPPTRQKT